jgi:hypothetical protein
MCFYNFRLVQFILKKGDRRLIDLNKQTKIARENAIRRCIPLDDRSILRHLQSEVIELITAEPMKNTNDLKRIANERDDIRFLYKYAGHIKDTEIGEAVDVLINTLTYLSNKNIDVESAFMIGQRVNSLRKD